MAMTEDSQDSGYRIMLVDDDTDDQVVFKDLICDHHYHVSVFSSGSSALSYLKQLCSEECPHLIVLDYQMPGLNGLELLIRLKQNELWYRIPVIIYSSDVNQLVQAKLKFYGALKFFVKAIDIRLLKDYLHCQRLSDTRHYSP